MMAAWPRSRQETARILSLCSGYGGLDLALRAVHGGRVVAHAETDRHAASVLAWHWPEVPNLGDLTTADFAQVGDIDWLTAGYPCQPFSTAGRRRGGSDPRNLWPAIADALRRVRPRHALLENVAAHLSLGFDKVLADLADVGYDARWGVVRASDAGAPHRRARLFVLATSRGEAPDGHNGRCVGRRSCGHPSPADAPRHAWRVCDRDDAAATDPRRQGLGNQPESAPGLEARPSPSDQPAGGSRPWAPRLWGPYASAIHRWECLTRPAPAPTAPAPRGGERLDPAFVEWLMGLPAGWVTAVPGVPRSAQLRVLGNGVVPAQAVLALAVLGDDDFWYTAEPSSRRPLKVDCLFRYRRPSHWLHAGLIGGGAVESASPGSVLRQRHTTNPAEFGDVVMEHASSEVHHA